MKKLFISQPMIDRTDEQIYEERKQALAEAQNELGEEVELIDSFCKEERTPLGYLAYSIECLAQADIAYFCKGWQDYRGCLIENECASKYGIQTILVDFDPHKTVIGRRIDAGLWD